MAENLQMVGWQAGEGVGRITLKRPPLNVLNIPMLRQLESVLQEAASDDSLRLLVLRAEGKLFSAGVDVADHTPGKVGEMIRLFGRVSTALAAFPAPTLAAVHGHALGGGCELVLCCDLVIAAEGANFGQPEIKLAAIAPVAALRLPVMVSYRRAAELLFTGELVEAAEAARIGLINRVVPIQELDKAVEQIASKLAGLSAAALRLCKQAIRLSADNWSRLQAMEDLYLEKLMSTEDAHEGLAAFMEKRAPAWKHK